VAPGCKPAARALVESLAPGAALKQDVSNTMKFELPGASLSLGALFGRMRVARADPAVGLLDWSVTSPTLENVFIAMSFGRVAADGGLVGDDFRGGRGGRARGI